MSCEINEPCGVLVVNKPEGWTSFDVVGRLRRLYGTKRIGHTGTLDPMATGVLVVLVGRAAKAAEYITVHDKSYRAVLKLGLTTDTEDTSGNILTRFSGTLPEAAVVASTVGSFVGNIMQVPPMYSALKIGGRKLCDIARSGGTVERSPRPITVYSADVEPAAGKDDEYILNVACSSGTYIRTLCADIGAALGCGGVMAGLCRLSVGGFTLDDALTPDEIAEMTAEERMSALLPVGSLFADLVPVTLPPFYEKLFRSGCEIYLKKIGADIPVGARVRVLDRDGGFFALGEVFDYPDGAAVKSVKTFVL